MTVSVDDGVEKFSTQGRVSHVRRTNPGGEPFFLVAVPDTWDKEKGRNKAAYFPWYLAPIDGTIEVGTPMSFRYVVLPDGRFRGVACEILPDGAPTERGLLETLLENVQHLETHARRNDADWTDGQRRAAAGQWRAARRQLNEAEAAVMVAKTRLGTVYKRLPKEVTGE